MITQRAKFRKFGFIADPWRAKAPAPKRRKRCAFRPHQSGGPAQQHSQCKMQEGACQGKRADVRRTRPNTRHHAEAESSVRGGARLPARSIRIPARSSDRMQLWNVRRRLRPASRAWVSSPLRSSSRASLGCGRPLTATVAFARTRMRISSGTVLSCRKSSRFGRGRVVEQRARRGLGREQVQRLVGAGHASGETRQALRRQPFARQSRPQAGASERVHRPDRRWSGRRQRPSCAPGTARSVRSWRPRAAGATASGRRDRPRPAFRPDLRRRCRGRDASARFRPDRRAYGL